MQVQFNSDSSVMGTENVAERIEASVREKLARFGTAYADRDPCARRKRCQGRGG